MARSESDILYPEGVKLKIGDKEKIIKPLVFKQRTQLLRFVTEIGIDLVTKYPRIKEGGMKLEDMLEPFIEIAGNKMLSIYSIILNEEPAWIEENLQLKDEIKLIQLVLEQNDIPFLISQVKTLRENIKEIGKLHLAK